MPWNAGWQKDSQKGIDTFQPFDTFKLFGTGIKIETLVEHDL